MRPYQQIANAPLALGLDWNRELEAAPARGGIRVYPHGYRLARARRKPSKKWQKLQLDILAAPWHWLKPRQQIGLFYERVQVCVPALRAASPM
jgi:hypothetical protein